MTSFTIEGFAKACKQAMSAAENRHKAASAYLQQVLAERSPEELIPVLDAAIPPDAGIGEMIVHQSFELTMLYGRIPARMQSGIHNHTVFACIAQLTGRERNVFYARDPEAGLRITGEMTTEAGRVLELAPDVIHSIENPGSETGSALHIYGGDFKALMERRSLWTSVGFEERPFSFPALMRESALAMQRDGNQAGLESLARAVPAMQELVHELLA